MDLEKALRAYHRNKILALLIVLLLGMFLYWVGFPALPKLAQRNF